MDFSEHNAPLAQTILHSVCTRSRALGLCLSLLTGSWGKEETGKPNAIWTSCCAWDEAAASLTKMNLTEKQSYPLPSSISLQEDMLRGKTTMEGLKRWREKDRAADKYLSSQHKWCNSSQFLCNFREGPLFLCTPVLHFSKWNKPFFNSQRLAISHGHQITR